ncbi:hypothetical protein ACK325_17680 [Aeromonas hydrophila]|uniref:hypothetical protein n=1 Tax=Aeromonas hydrophila TaxID=644 RepID=UPI002B27F083|nr:hypothetical protein R5M74_00560 [Aeromonas hydrophila]
MGLKVLLLGTVLGLLWGCASPSPTVKLNQPPLEVTMAELGKYWVQDGEVPPFEPVGGAPAKLPVKGYVEIRSSRAMWRSVISSTPTAICSAQRL